MKKATYNNIHVVIAAFNEMNNIAKVIKGLKRHGYHNIIVVDDCSKDNTYEIAEKNGAMVLRHVINLGQGAALKTGINHALKLGADVIITFDADDQHRPEDIKKLLHYLKKNNADIAIGSRFLKRTSKIPARRKFLLRGSTLILRMFYGVPVTDAHNGLRALTRKAAQKIEITSNRMEHASEIVDEIRKKRLKFVEVPVTINYTEQSLQKGEGNYIGAIRILLRMIFRKLL